MMTLQGLVICLALISSLTSALQKQTQQPLSSSTKCQDNPWFQFQGDFGYNCEWVAAQDDGLCNWEVVKQDNITNALHVLTVGRTHCPVSCGKCHRQVSETRVFVHKVCYYDAEQSDSRQGQVVVAFEMEYPQAQDWIGIYPASSEIQIGSTLNEEDPVAWSWACGISADGAPNMLDYDLSIACLTKYNQVTFRTLPPGIYQAVLVRLNNQVFAASPSLFEILGPSSAGSELCSQRKWDVWPLPPANHQAHLLQHSVDHDRFDSSVAQSDVFTVAEEQEQQQVAPGAGDIDTYNKQEQSSQQELLDCFDELYAQNYCNPEGQDFSIHFLNECHVMGPKDWLGFYPAEDCSEDDHLCHGEPLLWAFPCQQVQEEDGRCREGNVVYRFYGINEEDGSIALPTGMYRGVLVAEADDTGETYYASLISQPFQVHHPQDPCDLTGLQQNY